MSLLVNFWLLSLLVNVWLLPLLATVPSVHTKGVLTSAVHTLRTETGHCHVWLLSRLVTVTSGYRRFWSLSFLYTPRVS